MDVLGHRESRFGISVSSDGGGEWDRVFFSIFFLELLGEEIGMPLDLSSAQRYHSIASFVGGSPLESDKNEISPIGRASSLCAGLWLLYTLEVVSYIYRSLMIRKKWRCMTIASI